MSELRLAPDQLEDLARLVAEQLLARGAQVGGELVDAAELARRFGVTRDWIYRHKHELGGKPLTPSARPRWRFDPARVSELLERDQADEPRQAPRLRRARARRGGELLPIVGGAP